MTHKNRKMKLINKKCGLLLVVLLITILQLTAQISIVSTDMPSPDDIVRTSIGLNLDFINYQETGENYFWDFSQLTPISQSVDTFISLTDVPFLYGLFFLGSSNLVNAKSNSIPIPDFPITDSYTFFNNTNNYFGVAGEGFTLYGIPIPLKFGSHDKLYQFPMDYGNSGSSYAEYSISLPNVGHISKKISRSNMVDGWGILSTPYGTFEVLRQKSEVIEFDSIYIDSLGIGLPINREYTEYSWLGKGQKVPLLQITSSFGGVIVTYIDSARMLPSGVSNYSNLDIDNVKIFPVPTHDLINISFDLLSASDIQITIFNTMGFKVGNKTIFNHIPGAVNVKMSTRQFGLPDGIYLLKIISNNQQITKKLILY